jgi:hypothetical protein
MAFFLADFFLTDSQRYNLKPHLFDEKYLINKKQLDF